MGVPKVCAKTVCAPFRPLTFAMSPRDVLPKKLMKKGSEARVFEILLEGM